MRSNPALGQLNFKGNKITVGGSYTDPVAYGWVWEKQLRKAWWSGWLLPVVVAALLVAFFAMGLDKHKAKKNKWRVPEKTLFLFVLLGGGIGHIPEIDRSFF